MEGAKKVVLLTGVSGFVGRSLLDSLANTGNYCLRACARNVDLVEHRDVEYIAVGDLGGDIRWEVITQGVDVVVHAAARVHVMNDTSADPLVEFRKVNVAGTLNLARQAAASGVRRFIFISSIKVNGEFTLLGVPFTADDTPAPVDPYGVSKLEAEIELLALSKSTGMEVVIIRPVLVYGPGVKANFRNMMGFLAKGVPLPLPLGSVDNKRSLVALDNLVDLIKTCMAHPAAANQVFLVSDGNDVSTPELLRKVAHSVGTRAVLIPFPVRVLTFLATLLGKKAVATRLFSSLQVDISKNHQLLGWLPPVTLDAALKKTAEAYLESKSK
jgi:UDP-4-keto-D-QuiNAc 4-reductase